MALAPNLPKFSGDRTGAVLLDRLNQLLATTWVADNSGPERRQARIDSLSAAIADIAPKDETERMLAMQMVATDEAVLDALRRAGITGQTFEGRDANLKHAEKLMTTFARLMDTLDKHRGNPPVWRGGRVRQMWRQR